MLLRSLIAPVLLVTTVVATYAAVSWWILTGVFGFLTATGDVTTSAGILLAAVFAVLGVLSLVVLAQIGTVICLGVLLDTLVVRTVLVPALAMLLGDRFWWPRRFDTSASADREGLEPITANGH